MPAGTVAVVLAAGRGVRFGADSAEVPGHGLAAKLRVPVDGRPLVAHAIAAAAAAGVGRVRVTVPVGATAALRSLVEAHVPPGVSLEPVEVPGAEDGQATSLAAGITGIAADPTVDVVVVLLGDVVRPPAEAVVAVVAAVAAGAPAARADYDDGPGHPVAFARSALPALDGLMGDVGARERLDTIGTVMVAVPGQRPVDVDAPEDLARLGTPGQRAASGAAPDAAPDAAPGDAVGGA